MLREHHLDYQHVDGRIIPRWLTARDEVWLRALLDEMAALDGQTVGEAERRSVDLVRSLARAHGASQRAALGVWITERRRWRTRVAAPIAPETVRETVFPLAVGRTRLEALEEAGRRLGVGAAAIEASLFADRERERRLVAPAVSTSPTSLGERYNLALAQALVMRSSELTIRVREHARHVVRFAKLHGLMATFAALESGEPGTTARVSGPLALFHETTKYGRALGGLLATLATTPRWELRARVLLSEGARELLLDATAPLARTHALPAVTDSALEKALARDVRRAGAGWSLVREDTVLRVGSRLFFPDFTLLSPLGRVLVEIVGYWTPEYLAKKAEALASVRAPLVVCVDQRHADVVSGLGSGVAILPYRRTIDAGRLLEAAVALVGTERRSC